MGIVYPQTVKIKPRSKNIEYYRNLGYEIPMKEPSESTKERRGNQSVIDRNADIEVDIKDISPGASVKIFYTCDMCGELNTIIYGDYRRRHIETNKPLIYCRKCSFIVYSGENHPNWNPNKTQEERSDQRKYPEYYDFIKRVLARDKYICQCCGKKSEADMEVHHLNGYSWDIEHRTCDENGITLCKDCHKNFHSLYGKDHNTKEQFEEWIGYKVELSKYTGEIYNLPKVYCIEDNIIYKDRFEAAKQLGCSPTSIWNICTSKNKVSTYHGKHYIYYENYLKMTEQEIQELLKKGRLTYREDKRVICTNTGIVFDSPRKGAEYYNYKYVENINNSCNKVQKSAGKYNNISLQWMWLTDFQNLSLTEQLQMAEQNKATLQSNSYLLNLLNNNKLIN